MPGVTGHHKDTHIVCMSVWLCHIVSPEAKKADGPKMRHVLVWSCRVIDWKDAAYSAAIHLKLQKPKKLL